MQFNNKFELPFFTPQIYDEHLFSDFIEQFIHSHRLHFFAGFGAVFAFFILFSYYTSSFAQGVVSISETAPYLAGLAAFFISGICMLRKSWRTYISIVITILVMILSAIITYVYIRSGAVDQAIYPLAYLTLLVLNYALLNIRFIYATISGWTIFAMYSYAAFSISMPIASWFRDDFMMILLNLSGMFLIYRYEKNAQRLYLNATTSRLAVEEQQKISGELEEVKHKNAELSNLNENNRKTLEQKAQRERSLESQNAAYNLINDMAVRFIGMPIHKFDAEIIDNLKTLAYFCNANRAYIYLLGSQRTKLIKTHEWCATGVSSKMAKHEEVNSPDFAWFMNQLKKDQAIIVHNAQKLPAEAATQKAIADVEKVEAFINVPLFFKDKFVGLIGIDNTKTYGQWEGLHVDLLRWAGNIFMQVVQRKREHELNRESDGRMRRLFERTEDVVFISSPNGKLLNINPAGAKLFGYDSVEELLKVDIVKDLFVNPSDRVKYQRLIEAQGHVKEYKLTLKRKDGQHINVVVTATAVRNEDEKIIAYEGIIRDVTEKHQLEHQLFQSQKMESIGLLAGGIAHDFNNILTAINGYAEMILSDMNENHPHYKNVRSILRGGKRAENLTRQLLAFSRKQIIEPRVVNINQLIQNLKKMLNRLINEDINLTQSLNEDVARIKADPGQIEQTLVNLVINSRDAINELKDKSATREICIKTDNVYLDKNFVAVHPGSQEGHYVLIAVQDSGIGMDDETRQKIFDPFFTTKSEGQGTGLGLSTVYGIVKQNNGYVDVISEPEQGTTINIYWPITGEASDSSTQEESSELVKEVSETILVVEDDPEVREITCSFLENMGYNVWHASNGVEGLNVVKEKGADSIDLLLTDMVMPRMDGERLAEEVLKLNDQIKVILTSGYTDSKLMQSGFKNKGYFFLPKPYSIQKMAKKVRKVLDNSQS